MDATPAGRLRDGTHDKNGRPQHKEDPQKYKGDNAGSYEYRNDSHRDYLHLPVQCTPICFRVDPPCQAHTRDLWPLPAGLKSGVHWPGVEVHPPAPRAPRGAYRGVTRELPRRGPDRGLGRGRTGAGPRLGRAPEWSDCLRGVAGAPPGLLTPFAVKSATVRKHRGAVSGLGDCSRRS